MTISVAKIDGVRQMVVHDTPHRVLRPSEVEVAVEYAGASMTEAMSAQGGYILAPPMPYTPGYEFLGRVIRVGRKVTSHHVGDLVAGIHPRGGCYTDRLVVPAKYAVIVPSDTSKKQEIAASLINFLTAHALLGPDVVRPGETKVFVPGAAGGVGTAVLELCRQRGWRVFGSGSLHRKAFIEEQGAVFLDRNLPLSDQKTGLGTGADFVLDAFGYDSFRQTFGLLAPRGTFAAYGFFGKRPPLVESVLGMAYLVFRRLLRWGTRLRLVSVPFDVRFRTAAYREVLSRLIDDIDRGVLSGPPVTVMALEQATEAHQAILSGRIVGKCLLLCAPPVPRVHHG